MKIKTSAPISLDKMQTSTLHAISRCTAGSKVHAGTIFHISNVYHHLKRLRAQRTRTKRPFRRQRCVMWRWQEGTERPTEAAAQRRARPKPSALGTSSASLAGEARRSCGKVFLPHLLGGQLESYDEKNTSGCYQVWLPTSNLMSWLRIQEWVWENLDGTSSEAGAQECTFLTPTKNGFHAILSRDRNYLKASAIFQLPSNWEHMTAEIAWLAISYLWTFEEGMFLRPESTKKQKGKQES